MRAIGTIGKWRDSQKCDSNSTCHDLSSISWLLIWFRWFNHFFVVHVLWLIWQYFRLYCLVAHERKQPLIWFDFCLIQEWLNLIKNIRQRVKHERTYVCSNDKKRKIFITLIDVNTTPRVFKRKRKVNSAVCNVIPWVFVQKKVYSTFVKYIKKQRHEQQENREKNQIKEFDCLTSHKCNVYAKMIFPFRFYIKV